MQFVTDPANAVDLTMTPIHLGLHARAMRVDGFDWDPATLEAYERAAAADGADGRLVMIFEGTGRGTHWERHPAGDEVVACLSGRMSVICELDGRARSLDLAPGQATVNPRGTWHVIDVHGPGRLLTITPGSGTEHRRR